MNHEDFWHRLQEDWHSVSPAVDLAGLRRQVQRKRRRMQVLQTLDVLLGLVATAVMIKLMLSDHKPHTQLLFWGLLVLIWVAIGAGAWLRYSTWKPRSTDAASLLQLTIRRARAGFRFIWLNVAGLLVLYGIAVPFFWHLYSNGTPAQRKVVLSNLGLNFAIFVITVVWAIWYGRRQRQKIRRAQAMLRQLEQEDGGDR